MSVHKVGAASAGFVFNNEGLVLMQKRTGANGAGSWCPPGGKLDFGEHPKDAFMRETKEETDLDLYDVEMIGISNDVFEDDQLHFVTTWHVARSKGTPKILEPYKCLAVEWRRLDDMPSPLFMPTSQVMGNKEMMEKVSTYLKGFAS